MRARHVCAVMGIAAAVGAVVFMQSLVATNDAQSVRVAERLLKELPVEAGASVARLQLDFRPDDRVLQGPPMVAMAATRREGAPAKGECLVSRALFAQRRVRNLPPVGEELTLVGRRGAYHVKLAGYLDWERPLRGYPNMFVSPETAAEIGEEWTAFPRQKADELAPGFRSDAGRNMDRAKPLLLWAAALTALCLLLNSLFLSIEARRREIAVLRMVGLTRCGVARLVSGEALRLSAAGFALGVAAALAALSAYVAADPETFPTGMAVGWGGVAAAAVLTPVVALAGALVALRPALAVKPLEAASGRHPKRRPLGMFIALAFGYGAFVAVEVWGTSLTKPFIPSKEWRDAVVSILPGGVSAFDIEKLRSLPGVKWVGELQPLQVNLDPLEEMKGERGAGNGERRFAAYRNALLLASERLPGFRFVQGGRVAAEKAIANGDACVITEMMARARRLRLGDSLKLDCGRGHKMALTVAGIVDLNWHMVTSRGLLRGMNRMPVNTDGPVFVSFDTLAACDARPQEFVKMTHLWLDFDPAFLAEHGVFPAGRIVEREIVDALDGAWVEGDGGEVLGNTVRLHARDEISDGTLSHGADLVGAMARVPFIFLAVISLGFVAMLVASADARRREFVVMRAVGATRMQLARVLVGEALRVVAWATAAGLAGGALVGWLCTAGTRAAMANWGLPPSFVLPLGLCAKGALGALAFSLAVAVPTAVALVRPRPCGRGDGKSV